MRKSFAIAVCIGLALVVILGFVAHTAQRDPSKVSSSGAFRDGLYEAKLDAELGRKASIRTGRWRSDGDRAVFLAGYHQGSESAATVSNLPSGPELAGFRDGVANGAEARRSEQPFALRTGILQVQSTDGRDARYVQAYANGYQYGYYGNPEILESGIPSRGASQF